MPKSTLSIHEAAVVAAICFGFFIFQSVQAVLHGFPQAQFSDAGSVWGIGIEAVFAACALLYLQARSFDIRALAVRPDMRGTLLGLLLFLAAWIVGAMATAPFFNPEHAQVAEMSYQESMAMTVAFAMVNGTFEEVFLLGALVRGLRGYGLSLAIGLPLLVRMLYHLYQGPLGVVWILAFGLTFTLFYVFSGRLWPAVFAHILWDIVPVVVARG